MQLMRNQLKQIFSRVNDAHAGLLMHRGLTDWEENEKPIKARLIDTVANVTASDLYVLAFDRWLNATHEDSHETFATVAAKVDGRLLTGLALGGTLETAATTHHTYGMPMLAGSSIKGAVRSYTEHLFAERDENGAIQFEKSDNVNKLVIQEQKQNILDILFGTDAEDDHQGDAGYLIWHDAWWIPMVSDQGSVLPGNDYKPFVGDVVTVHHPKYYSRELDAALDMENPVPNQQIAIQGSFYFVIQGEQKWVHFARELLKETLANTGLGAKGASGYGYFTLDDTLNNEIAKRYSKGVPVDIKADPLGDIRQKIKYLDEAQLIYNLSKSGRTKFFKQLVLDKSNAEDVQKVVQVVLEEHSDFIVSWATIDAKNTKEAYKFIQDNKLE
ncbi:type III-B CRISPR module RAMP protein Cmr6 [Psychrobacter alimentarius]|uniref:type III-B CRISPR module RAMP protein Cmr6 n=1 Tax=Psychrobacter alimentarius TaxID=261164 RepID=UPI003FD6465C